MKILEKIKRWFVVDVLPPPSIATHEWDNESLSGRNLDLRALSERHQLYLYLTTVCPVKELIVVPDLNTMSANDLRKVVRLDVSINPVTFQAVFSFIHETFSVEEYKEVLNKTHPMCMKYINRIEDYEKKAANYVS